MQKITALLLVLFLTILLHGCTAASPIKRAVEITPDKTHFKNHLNSTDRKSSKLIELSTLNGFRKKPRNIHDTWADSYISAAINKRTGEITYQINSVIEYKDHDKRSYRKVSYRTILGKEKETKEAKVLNHTISCQGSAYSGCIHTEYVVFTIDSTLIESLANSYAEEPPNKWRYQLSPKKGRSYSAHLFIAEIAALVEKANSINNFK